MSEPISLIPIGVVSSSRDAAIDDDWDAVTATITLDTGRRTLRP